MAVRIELKGAKVALAGRFTGWGYERKIEEGGGEVTNVISARLTCLVAGLRAGSKAARAAARGVPIITEAQLAALLKHGALTLKEEDAPRQRFDEAVAELRGIFGAAPTSEGWTRCVEILEACDPERLDDLVSYAEPFVDAWDTSVMPRWEAPKGHALLQNMPTGWSRGNPDREVRVAPPAWLYELLQGRYSAKHAVIRALNLEGLKLNGALGESLLASPHLRGLRFVGLGSKARLPASFYRALVQSASVGGVRELWLDSRDPGLDEAWRGDEAIKLDALLVVRSYRNFYPNLLEYSFLSSVEIKYVNVLMR